GLFDSSCALTFWSPAVSASIAVRDAQFSPPAPPSWILAVRFAVLFEELIEQHRVHRIVTHAVDLTILVADDEVRINCCASSAINPIQACSSYGSWSERLPG